MPFVYILRCSDGSLYVGHTADLTEREKAHNNGTGARYTAARRPIQVVHFEIYDSIEETLRRERQLKRWSRGKKEALIQGDVAALKALSRRATR